MFEAVSTRNTATDHGGIIYHAPPASNYVLTAGRHPAGVSQVMASAYPQMARSASLPSGSASVADALLPAV